MLTVVPILGWVDHVKLAAIYKSE